MANILGLKGLSTPFTNILMAAYGNDMVNVATGKGYGLALNPSYNVEFESFLGSLFFQNGANIPLSFDGQMWSTKNVARVPLAKFIRVWRSRSRMYLGYIDIQDTPYPSRIWYCDLPSNNTIQWGFEQGSNLQTLANNPLVSAFGAGFSTFGLQRGDPFFILDGPDAGEYNILAVNADQQVTISPTPQFTNSGLHYWAGGNFFDVGPDDGDFLTWMELNNDLLLSFKRDTLYKIQQSDGSSIVQIRGAYGTTSGRSVANLHEVTIYWHSGIGQETGFYAFNGLYSQKISAPIDNHIAGMNPVNYTKVVAWKEGELYRAYVGNLVNKPYNINITNAVVTWDYITKTWSIDPIPDIPVVSTELRQSGNKLSYFGTTTDSIMVTPQGNLYNKTPIPFAATSAPLYPAGSSTIVEMSRVQVISTNMKGVQVQYRLKLKPFNSDKEFKDLGEINGDRTELFFKTGQTDAVLASGIEFRFLNDDGTPAEGYIKKATLFWIPKTNIIT